MLYFECKFDIVNPDPFARTYVHIAEDCLNQLGFNPEHFKRVYAFRSASRSPKPELIVVARDFDLNKIFRLRKALIDNCAIVTTPTVVGTAYRAFDAALLETIFEAQQNGILIRRQTIYDLFDHRIDRDALVVHEFGEFIQEALTRMTNYRLIECYDCITVINLSYRMTSCGENEIHLLRTLSSEYSGMHGMVENVRTNDETNLKTLSLDSQYAKDRKSKLHELVHDQ